MPKLKIISSDIKEFNNLYRISKDNFEKYKTVEAYDVIHKTKFYKLLLKEWFDCLQVNGTLYISIEKENNILNNWGLRQVIFGLLNEYIEYDSEVVDNITVHKVTKTKSTKVKDDEITKWSFGIVTNGIRLENISKLIDSIIEQNIPSYEIIICGKVDTLFLKKYKNINIVYIEFTQRDKLGWITKKKNLICEKAKYNNIAVFHDRFILDKDWYKGMQKYGNNFEVLSCSNIDLEGNRSEDWSLYGKNKIYLYSHTDKNFLFRKNNFPVLLDYRDWDETLFIPGGSIIIKKNIWKKVKWDERIHWMEEEDVLLSHILIFEGKIPRFNIYSKLITLERRGNLKYKIIYKQTARGNVNLMLNYFVSKIFKRIGN